MAQITIPDEQYETLKMLAHSLNVSPDDFILSLIAAEVIKQRANSPSNKIYEDLEEWIADLEAVPYEPDNGKPNANV